MIAKKLFIKPKSRFLILNPPKGFEKTLEAIPEGSKQDKELSGSTDLVLVFVKMKKELESEWSKITAAIKQDAIFWIAYPKKSSGLVSDLAMMSGSWEVYKNSPWQPVAMVSIDETWTGVRFKFLPTIEKERSERTTENIFDSDGTLCVDKKNRIIYPTKDLHQLLDKNPKAKLFFESLSFTNKKEYVVWIIDAKREETRTLRLKQAIDKLNKGKKNPGEK